MATIKAHFLISNQCTRLLKLLTIAKSRIPALSGVWFDPVWLLTPVFDYMN